MNIILETKFTTPLFSLPLLIKVLLKVFIILFWEYSYQIDKKHLGISSFLLASDLIAEDKILLKQPQQQNMQFSAKFCCFDLINVFLYVHWSGMIFGGL